MLIYTYVCYQNKFLQSKRNIENLHIMIWIVSSFCPCVAWNIQYFSFLSWIIAYNQWSFVNLRQRCSIMIVLRIGLTVKNKSVVAKLVYIIYNLYIHYINYIYPIIKRSIRIAFLKVIYLSHPRILPLPKQRRTRSSGKLNVPHAPIR